MIRKKLKNAAFETVINNNESIFQNTLDFFPIGLLILEKDNDSNDYKITNVNSYLLKLLDLPKNLDIKVFKERMEEFKRWENNHLSETNLKKIIFESEGEEHQNKIQSGTYISPLSMIYVKIKVVKKNIYICMDNYNDERKSIQNNLIKSIKYQYIVTLYHELNNPLNALQNTIEENINEETRIEENKIEENSHERKTRYNNINLLVNLIKVFIKNFIWYFRVIFENTSNLKINPSIKINLEYQFNRILHHFSILFKYKEIDYSNNFSFLNDKYIESNEDYLNNFLRGIYVLLYHMIPRKGGFQHKFNIIKGNQIKINFIKIEEEIKKTDRRKSKIINDIDFGFKEEFDFSKTVQTIEITKELLLNMSEMLKIKFKIYEEDEKLLLSIILPFTIEKEDIEEINEYTQEKKDMIIESINRKIFLPINEDKFIDNATSHINKRYSSNIQSSSIKNSQNPLYNIKINGDEQNKNCIKNINNNINNSFRNSKNYENLELISLENDPFIKVTKDKNFKTMEISNDTEISNVSIAEIKQSKTTKPKRKTFSNEESIHFNEKFRPIKNGYLAVGRLSDKNVSYNTNEKQDIILNEISISYNNKITAKTTPRENSSFEIIKTSNFNKCNCNCNDVLLCDDENFNLTSLKNMLKKYNVECDSSTNGKECIDLIENKKKLKCNCDKKNYKLIFLDMMMPIMNGLDAAKKIEKMIDNKEISELKIIIVSAHIEENLLKQLKNIKCIVEMIHKPLKKSKLGELLNTYYFTK